MEKIKIKVFFENKEEREKAVSLLSDFNEFEVEYEGAEARRQQQRVNQRRVDHLDTIISERNAKYLEKVRKDGFASLGIDYPG